MSELRSTAQRKADTLARLEAHGDAWLATASRQGGPHLVVVAQAWDGEQLVIATREGTPTARNLDETRVARLALGSADDVVMIEASVVEMPPVAAAPAERREA
ncbi:MAG TPA: pyridoxamine 5'-phosphate oxidase family protein, partial [Candidatus Dormibacteraeota bacterium]|nr:pyridoxamine 5'-phosphate oxidase family protein [Candidatus Dormibacteraeota bacterium]